MSEVNDLESMIAERDTDIERLKSQVAELLMALKPFTVEKPIGVASWWLKDFENAGEVYQKVSIQSRQ